MWLCLTALTYRFTENIFCFQRPNAKKVIIYNLIIFQEDATVFSLLYFCSQLYMLRVSTPIIRSS